MKIGRNDSCPCGSGEKYKNCHMATDEKIKSYEIKGHMVPEREMIKTREQIKGIKESGILTIQILDAVEQNIRAGMTTQEIDDIVLAMTDKLGGIPAPLHYQGYPKSVCTSVNDQVCHGIPATDVILKEGDIVNVDVSTLYKDYYSDASRMFAIGKVGEEKKRLIQIAKECIKEGLSQVKPWGFMGDMGQAINDYAKKYGYSVVVDIGGHGVGLEFHEAPFVSYVTKKGTEMLLVPGMVFTIEPMINMGTADVYTDESDGWTVYTRDGLPSAQWEVTVAVTEFGYQVLAY